MIQLSNGQYIIGFDDGYQLGYHPSDCMEAFSSHYSDVILQPDSMKVI